MNYNFIIKYLYNKCVESIIYRSFRTYYLIVFLLFLNTLYNSNQVFAQTINTSVPEKTSTNNYDYTVLGKTSEGILIYKYNSYESILECYDDAMNKKWFKTAQLFSKNNEIQHISISNNKLNIFYSFEKNGFVYLCAQAFTASLQSINEVVHVDSVPVADIRNVDWIINHNDNKNNYLIRYFTNKAAESCSQQCILVDGNFNIITRKTIELDIAPEQVIDVLPDNDGNIYVSYVNYSDEEVENRKLWNQININIYKLNSKKILKRSMIDDGFVMINGIVKLDNINKNIVVAALAKPEKTANVTGYYITLYNIEKDSFISQGMQNFNEEIQHETSLDPDFSFNNLIVKDVILKFDGGCMAIAELAYKTVQVVEVANVYTPTAPSFRTYTYYHTDDILVTEYNSNGSSAWEKLLRKKQNSERNPDLYSSVGIMKDKAKILILFNEDLNEQANLMAYFVKDNAQINRNSIYGSRQKNIFLMPKYATQVSAYELVIPSEYKGYLQFVKFDF